MKKNDKTPKKNSGTSVPSTPSSNGGSSSSGYTTPISSAPLTVFTPISPGGIPLSASRKNKDRADTPDAPEAKTTTEFISYEDLRSNYDNFAHGHGILFLLRELGLRLLYNSDRNDYYEALRSAGLYRTDFHPETGIDFAHKLFALVRNNHRFHKISLSSKERLEQDEQEISVEGTIKIIEKFLSPLENRSPSTYYETIKHDVIYTEDPSNLSGYYRYNDINSHAIDYFPGGNFSSTLKESFKRILKGKSISSTLSAQQKKFIYTLFYHLFAIEGARDCKFKICYIIF